MKVKILPILGIFLIAIMIVSTLAYTLMSSHSPLPEGNVIDYELDVYNEEALLRQGKVLMKLFYERGCLDCEEKIYVLENLVKSYSDQIFLEKIVLNESIPKLHFIGFNITQSGIYLSEKELRGEDITEEKIMNILCEVMIKPPTTKCVKI